MRTDLLLSIAAFALLGWLAPPLERTRTKASEPARDLASSLPSDALVRVEAPGLAELCSRGVEHPFVRAVLGSEFGELLLASSPASLEVPLARAERALGTPLLPALALLSANGAALGVAYRDGKPAWILAMRGDDPARVRRVLERGLALAAEKAGFPGALDRPAKQIDGADAWLLGEELVVAVRGASVVASNVEARVLEVLERERSATAASASPNDSASRPGGELLRAWIDLDGLAAVEAAPNAPKDRVRVSALRAIAGQPQAQTLLGPGVCALGRASELSLSLSLRGEDLELAVRAEGVDAGASSVLFPASAPPELLAPPGSLASAVLHRDLGALFAERSSLFAPESLPALAKTNSDLALFFGGMDLADEVLPGLSPWLRTIVRPVAFDAGAAPEIPLPALALLVELEDPETLGPSLVSAFQTAIGLVNVDRAQKGKDALLLEVKDSGGIQVTSARFKKPRAGEGVDVRYNFVPACALAGKTFVLGSHVALVADLAQGELARGTSPATVAGTVRERLELRGPELAAVVDANAEALVMNAVLNEGKPRAKAESDIRGLAALLRLVRVARIELGYADARALELVARFDLAPAGE